jgi:hypothetical protein
LLEFGDVQILRLWSLGKECSVAFSSRVDLSIDSWAWGYKDNDAHPGSKKEQYLLRYFESGSLPACHHGWSVFFLSMICDS